jgi:hypothetical protein
LKSSILTESLVGVAQKNCLTLYSSRMSSCQNPPPFSVSACGQAVSYIGYCLQKVGSSHDNLIQYITEGSHLNTGSSSTTYTDPQILQIFKSCICGNDAQNHIQFLLCYDKNCVKELNANVLTGSGLYWNGFCLIKE